MARILTAANIVLAASCLLSISAKGADWTPDPSLNLPDQRIRLYKIARTYCESHYDASANAIQRDMRHAHPHMTGVTLSYASGLLMTKDPKDRAFAESLIENVLTKQNLDPKSPNYGSFLPYFEDDWATVVNPDQNYGQFLGIGLAGIIEQDNKQGHLLTPALRKKVEDAFRLTVGFTIRRDVDPGYVNISIFSAAVGAAGDKLLGYPGAKEFALSKIYWLLARAQPGTTFTEYLAPTYYGADLGAAYALKEFASTPDLQKPTDQLIDAFWRDIAASYHAPTFQLGGPHSRSYGDNMLAYAAGLKYFLFFALNGKYPLSDVETDHSWDLAGLFGVASTRIDPRPEFDAAPAPWRQVQVAQRPGMIVSQYRKENLMVGSISTQSVWQQQRNVVAYWLVTKPWWDVGFCLDESALTLGNGYAHFFATQTKGAVLAALSGKMPNPATGGLKLVFNNLADGKPASGGPSGGYEVQDGDVTTYVYPVTQNSSGAMAYSKDADRAYLQRGWDSADHVGNVGILAYLVIFRNADEPVPDVREITFSPAEHGASISAVVNGETLSLSVPD